MKRGLPPFPKRRQPPFWRELQGLRRIAVGVGFAVPFGVFFLSASGSEAWFGTAALVTVLLVMPMQWWAGR
jgi:hypothetical protein